MIARFQLELDACRIVHEATLIQYDEFQQLSPVVSCVMLQVEPDGPGSAMPTVNSLSSTSLITSIA